MPASRWLVVLATIPLVAASPVTTLLLNRDSLKSAGTGTNLTVLASDSK